MTKDFTVPEELQPAFARLMRYAPPECRQDPEFLELSLVYLKLGGERLARQHLEFAVKPFCEEFDIVKRRMFVDSDDESDEEDDDEEDRDESDDEEDEEDYDGIDDGDEE